MLENLRRHFLDRHLSAIAHRPRYVPGCATVQNITCQYADAASFATTYRDIFLARAYHFSPTDDTPRILDCGANIGLASLYWKRAFPDARITAFEPDPSISEVLRRNLTTWGFPDIEVVQAAVGNRDGHAIFQPDHADGGRVTSIKENPTGLEVKVVDLSRWLTEPIDLLKIDIEGAEVDLLNTCRNNLGTVANLIVEYHDIPGEPQRLDELLKVLREAGFRYHSFSKALPVKPLATSYGPSGTPQMIDVFATRNRAA